MKKHMKQLTLTVLALTWFAGIASGECTTNLRVPTDWWFWIPTTGDLVYCEGSMHILMTYTADNAGGAHGRIQFQPQGLSGEVIDGPNLGAKYQATGITQETFNVKKGATQTFINNYRCIGEGQAPDLTVHETWHITINANGEVTAVVDNVKVTCD